jgi:hypothetical protein
MGPGLCACIGLCLCQAKPLSHTTQPLNIRFGIGFMVALALPLSNAQRLVYKIELPTCLRQACMYAWSGGVGLCALLCVVPLGSRRRGSWLPYICISSCHSSFLVVWWFRPFLHNIGMVSLYVGMPNLDMLLSASRLPTGTLTDRSLCHTFVRPVYER